MILSDKALRRRTPLRWRWRYFVMRHVLVGRWLPEWTVGVQVQRQTFPPVLPDGPRRRLTKLALCYGPRALDLRWWTQA